MLMRSLVIVAAIWPALSAAAPPVDPVQPQAEVPPVVYRSAFTHYQAMPESEKAPDKVWREANETVARIGGHAGYLRDEKEADKPSAPPAATPHHAH
jgi:hypothetical protein